MIRLCSTAVQTEYRIHIRIIQTYLYDIIYIYIGNNNTNSDSTELKERRFHVLVSL